MHWAAGDGEGIDPLSPRLGLRPGERPCRVSMGVTRETAARALSAVAACQEGVDCYRSQNSAEGPTAKASLPRPGRACGLRLSHGLGAGALPRCPPGGTVCFRANGGSASRPTGGYHLPGTQGMGSGLS